MNTSVLYISYDGLLEPLGQSQILAYVRRLVARHRMSLVTYEKEGDWADMGRRAALRAEVERAGIEWHPLRYHKRPSTVATAYDVGRGLSLCGRIVRQQGVEIVHARSYVPSLIALRLKRRFGARFLFDMRGLWPDEKVDAGTWSRSSAVYRLAKRFERAFLTNADSVVSLTHAGVEAISKLDYLRGEKIDFTVVPTCADLERFHPPLAPPDGPFTLGYVGNTKGWYRFEPVISAFEAIRAERPDARLLVLNRGQHESILACLAAHKVPRQNVELKAVDYADVPDAMRGMDAAAFFIEPTFSKRASAPTKLAELLGCGVPCLVNDGVGDCGRIVREARVGVVVENTSMEAAAGGALQLVAMADDPAVRSRCVETAARHFSLTKGVAAYDSLYERLGNGARV